MTALQDPGKEDTKKKERTMIYPKMNKVMGKIFDILKQEERFKIPKGANRHRSVVDVFTKKVIQQRKHMDYVDVHDEFKAFAGPNDKVYILKNDLEYFGFEQPLRDIVMHYSVRAIQQQDLRVSADAIRVAAVMLLPEYQGPCASFLRGTKDTRAKQDQSVDVDIAWAVQALETFKDPNFTVPYPDCMRQSDVEGIDPNEEERYSIPREPKWFINTWKHYLKKKYKAAIGRWDKETGGGSREPEEFADYCDKNSRWLVWVYLMDIERDFLLFSNAKGKPPEYVGREAGFPFVPTMNDTDTDQDVQPVASSRKRKSGTMTSSSIKKRLDDRTNILAQLMEEMTSVLKANAPYQQPSGGSGSYVDMTGSKLLQAICTAGKKKKDLEEYTDAMSPATRACVLGGIEQEIVALGKQYRDHVTSGISGPC